MADPRNRKCLNGLTASTPVKVPAESEFEPGKPYTAAPALDEIVQLLIRSAPHALGDVLGAEVVIGARWQKRAPSSHGEQVLASLKRCSGALGYETGLDYLVYVSADLARELGVSHWQLEAALYHELKHIKVETDTEGKVTLASCGHDAEVFSDELRIYGPWMAAQAIVMEAFKQAPLFGDVVETFDRQRKAKEAAGETAD